MSETSRTAQSLLRQRPSLERPLRVVHRRTDGGRREVTWSDVRDELTSGEWGTLIERGVLVEGSDGFVLDDPDAVDDALGTETSDSVSDETENAAGDNAGDEADEADNSWTRYDKMAGMVTVVLFFGYSVQQERSIVAHGADVVLGALDHMLPFYIVILLLAIVTGLYSTLLQSNLMDSEAMARYQEQMQDIQERRKAAKERGDDEALEAIQEEQMEAAGDQLGMFKVQFRPMVWIMLITIPVFLWMRWKVSGHVDPNELHLVVPLAGRVALTKGLAGPMPTWIVWYFLCSMAFGQLIRKTLNLRPAATS